MVAGGTAGNPAANEPAELPGESMATPPAVPWRALSAESDLGVLIKLAVPSILATISGTVMSFVDFAFVSQLGSAAQAAVGNAAVLVWAFFGLSLGIVSTVSTFASQALGRERPREGAGYMWQAVWLSLAMGAISAAILPLVPPVYAALGHPQEVLELEVVFTRILLLGAGPLTAAAAISNYFNGIHKPAVTMVSMIAANVFNALAGYVLVFGHWGFPKMGVAGAATATLAALVVRLAWLLAALSMPRVRGEFGSFASWRYDWQRMKALLTIGAPAGLQWLADVGTWAIFTNWLISKFGTVDIAATQIVWKLLELSWMPAIGIGVGINAVVGKAIGQGDIALAQRRTRAGMLLCVGYMGFMGLVFAAGRHVLPELFTDEADVLSLTPALMLLGMTFQIFDAMSISYGSALRGAGDTRWPAIVSAAYAYGIVIFGGWIITLAWPGIGSIGPWITNTVYAIFVSLTLRYRWQSGRWRELRIFAERDEHRRG